MTLLDGKKLAEKLEAELKKKVAAFFKKTGVRPGLATVRVGENEASKVYVSRKAKLSEEVGMHSKKIELPEDTTELELLEVIQNLNHDRTVHGILVQLPLPKQISSDRILSTVEVTKDVDGFHPINVGNLSLGRPRFVPCTPLGIIRLLEEYRVPIEGKDAVVIGRSNIVGKPMAQLLLKKNATVTIAHSKTKSIQEICKKADILVAAIGKPHFVRGDWVKEGACLIDVGINRTEKGTLTGDIDFEEASKKAGWITPVPGGVGPLTIAMLLENTLKAAQESHL